MWSTRFQCGKVYVGEAQRCLETRVKEHRDACNKGDTGKSAIAEHQWDQQHQVNWEGTRVVDRASRPVQLRALKTPTNNRLNHDEGYELPGCWITTVKKLGGGVSSSRASTNHISTSTSAQDCMRAQAQKPCLLKYFYNKNFQIYGMALTPSSIVCSYAHTHTHTHTQVKAVFRSVSHLIHGLFIYPQKLENLTYSSLHIYVLLLSLYDIVHRTLGIIVVSIAFMLMCFGTPVPNLENLMTRATRITILLRRASWSAAVGRILASENEEKSGHRWQSQSIKSAHNYLSIFCHLESQTCTPTLTSFTIP